jgi:hypothetical protein
MEATDSAAARRPGPGLSPNRKATTMTTTPDRQPPDRQRNRETGVVSLSAQACANIALASLAISALLTLFLSSLYRSTLL